MRIGTYGGSNACQWYVVLVLELLVMASIYSTSNLVRSHMRRSSRLSFTGFVFMYASNHQPAPKQFNPAPQRPAAPEPLNSRFHFLLHDSYITLPETTNPLGVLAALGAAAVASRSRCTGSGLPEAFTWSWFNT